MYPMIQSATEHWHLTILSVMHSPLGQQHVPHPPRPPNSPVLSKAYAKLSTYHCHSVLPSLTHDESGIFGTAEGSTTQTKQIYTINDYSSHNISVIYSVTKQ